MKGRDERGVVFCFDENDNIEKIYDAIQEELSRESVIGYNWDKKSLKT